MKQLLVLNPENASEEEIAAFGVRESARAVVEDEQGNIALLHVTKRGYYKLPGGGIEEGESKEDALRRECIEEIGCDVEVLGAIGSVVEYRKFLGITQVSYCYRARVHGGKGTPKLDQGEAEAGFETVWLERDAVERALRSPASDDLESRAYIVPRDTRILQAFVID